MDAKKLRKDFTVLQKEIGGSVPIYFDNACQTLRPRQVTEAVTEYYESFPACAGRSVHKFATEVSLRCDAVRARAAAFTFSAGSFALGAGSPIVTQSWAWIWWRWTERSSANCWQNRRQLDRSWTARPGHG